MIAVATPLVSTEEQLLNADICLTGTNLEPSKIKVTYQHCELELEH